MLVLGVNGAPPAITDLSDRERIRQLATFMLEDQLSGVTIGDLPLEDHVSEVTIEHCDQPAGMSRFDIVRGVTMSLSTVQGRTMSASDDDVPEKE